MITFAITYHGILAAAALRVAGLPVRVVPAAGDGCCSFDGGYSASREDLATVGYGIRPSLMAGVFTVQPMPVEVAR